MVVGFGTDQGSAAAVLAQDACLSGGRIDRRAIRKTVFLPAVLVSDGRHYRCETEADFDAHLDDLENYAAQTGVTHFRTRIVSETCDAENSATVTAMRDHMAGDRCVATVSMTFGMMRVGAGWRMHQIHFNDHRADTSAVTQILRSRQSS